MRAIVAEEKHIELSFSQQLQTSKSKTVNVSFFNVAESGDLLCQQVEGQENSLIC